MAVMAAELVRLNIKADGDGKQTTPKRIRLDSTPSSYAFDTMFSFYTNHILLQRQPCCFKTKDPSLCFLSESC